MKKALAIISALAIASAFVFAEDAPALKLSGYIDTGIKAVITDSKTASDTVQLWGDDSGSMTRFDLNGTYTNGNAGVDFKLRTQTIGAPAINYFHAWTSLFDGKAKLVAGKLDNSAWKTEGDDGFTCENDEGIQVQIMPVAGLNVGVKFNTNGTRPRPRSSSSTSSDSAVSIPLTSSMWPLVTNSTAMSTPSLPCTESMLLPPCSPPLV